MMELKSISRFS